MRSSPHADDETRTAPAAGHDRRVLVYWQDHVSTHRLPERGSITVGRSRDCDIQIDHPSVSRRHVALRVGEGITVEDLGSSNGSVVNGTKLVASQPMALPAGAVIEVGLATLVIHGNTPLAIRPRGHREGGASGADHEPTMQRLYRLVDLVADADISVLLLGETGVGKEVMAEAIHAKSKRASNPLVRINCAAVPEALLESELFGHERGAFTGAQHAKPGLLETADGGTLFLDEVADLPLATQGKLLRTLESREVLRLGALRPRHVDVRLLAATNADLEARLASSAFRHDLFYRLNGISITIPPLRSRVSEIAPLAHVFLEGLCRDAGRPVPVIQAEVLDAFAVYAWPGNVRELKNVVERAVVLSAGGPLSLSHLPAAVAAVRSGAPRAARSNGGGGAGLRSDLEALERRRITDALGACDGNQTKAAKLLGISRRMLVGRLDTHGLPRPRKGRGEPP